MKKNLITIFNPDNIRIEKTLILLSFLGLFTFLFPNFVYAGCIYMSILLVLYTLYSFTSQIKLTISSTTIISILLVSYIVIYGIYNQDFEYKKHKYYLLVISLILLYFNNLIFSKHVKFTSKTILTTIVGFNLIFMLKLLFSKYDSAYSIEYHFINTGLYAIFLSLCTVIFSTFYKQLNFKYTNIVTMGLGIITSVYILFLGSRTALIVLFSYYVLEFLKTRKYSKKIKYIIGIGSIALLTSILTFYTKESSSSGRFFIWKTTSSIIKDNYLTGIGYANFAAVYPTYQASMFDEGQMTTKEIRLADNTVYAFNEYLHLTTELGIIGLVLILSGIIIFLIYAKDSTPLYLCICIALIFSYMLHSPIISYLLILLLSTTRVPPVFKLNSITSKVVLIVIMCFALHTISFWTNKYKCTIAANILWKQSPNLINAYYKKSKDYLGDNIKILYDLAEYNYNHNNIDEALSLLRQLDRHVIINDTELLKGKCYIKKEALDLAEKHLSLSVSICPNRFVNRYELFKFYIDNNMTDKAIEVAKGIHNLEEKIRSPKTIIIKKHILYFLNKNNILPKNQ